MRNVILWMRDRVNSTHLVLRRHRIGGGGSQKANKPHQKNSVCLCNTKCQWGKAEKLVASRQSTMGLFPGCRGADSMIPGDESELINSFYSESELTRPVRHQVQGEQMRQAKLTFNAAIAIGALGTLVLLSGIVVSFFDVRRGVSPTAAGIVMDVLSFFAIKFHRETNQ